MSLKIRQRPLGYVERLDSRNIGGINLFVVHCTELPDLEMARVYGERVHHPETRTGNSGHFYIDRDGSIEQWVPLDRVAHHVKGYNPKSIGVELVNSGRYPDWFDSDNQTMSEPYPEAQIKALVALIDHLKSQLTGLEIIAGHEDLDTGMVSAEDRPDVMIRRKLDPGPMFPWQQLLNKVSLQRFYAESP